jgi:signal transduction histidine kinase
LTMRMHDEAFELTVEDNGHGFCAVAAERAGRNGLSNLRSRVAEISGKLELSTGETGTRITVRLSVSNRGFRSGLPLTFS